MIWLLVLLFVVEVDVTIALLAFLVDSRGTGRLYRDEWRQMWR